MRIGRLFFHAALFLATVVGLERVVTVYPEFMWRQRASNDACAVYRSLHQRLSSYGSKVFLRSGTVLWKDTMAEAMAGSLHEPIFDRTAPTTFTLAHDNRVPIGSSPHPEEKQEFTVDTSSYFEPVTAEKTLFIRHCFDDAASFYDGLWPVLNVREALFGSLDVMLWDVSPVGISPDGRYALLFAENFCGPMCGVGEFYLFERRGGTWVLAGTSMRWIS